MVRELKGFHVLGMLLLFFGVTIGVNGIFVSYALSTFAGEDVSQPYLKGLAFNDSLALQDAQRALGWTAQIIAQRDGLKGHVLVSLHLRNQDGQDVNALSVRVMLRHPVNAHLDRHIDLKAMGNGVYSATVAGLNPGQWDIVAETKSGNEIAFQARRRVVLP